MSKSVLSIIGLVILALVVTACGDTPPPTTSEAPGASVEEQPEETTAEEPEETAAEEPAPSDGRLALVQERGQLICGVNGSLPGFSFLDENGENTGFDADFCRALAAAVLGDSEAVEFRALSADQRGPALQTGEVDVLIRNTTWTVSRDTTWGLFAPTTFYDGQAMMVNSTLVDATTLEDLAGATICVQSGTTTELNLTDQFRSLGIEFTPQTFPDIDPTYAAYEEGRCDAVTSDRSQLVARRTAFENPDDHVILEELEITQANVADMAETSENPVVLRLLGQTVPDTDPFDSGLGLDPDWVINVISAVGNYGEIFDRNLGPGTPFEL